MSATIIPILYINAQGIIWNRHMDNWPEAGLGLHTARYYASIEVEGLICYLSFVNAYLYITLCNSLISIEIFVKLL